MKKLKSILLALCMLNLCTANVFAAEASAAANTESAETALAASVNLTLSDAEASAGDTVLVEVSVASYDYVNNIAIAGLTFDETVLEFEGFVNPGNVVLDSNSMFGEQGFDHEKKTIVIAYMSQQMPTGKICDLQFKIKDNASFGEYSVTFDQFVTMFNSADKDNAITAGRVIVSDRQAPDVDLPEGGTIVNLVEYGTPVKGPQPLDKGSLADAFDGDPNTVVDFGVDGGEDYWVGIKFEQPTVLTKVEMFAYGYNDGVPFRPHILYGSNVEGSNDGENWTPILALGDNYAEYEEYAWDMKDGLGDWWDEDAFDGETDWDDDATDPAAYTYYRVYNDTKGIAAWGDIRLYGYFQSEEIIDYTLGDINMDGAVDISDAILLFQHSMLPDVFPIAYPGHIDFTGDEKIDLADAYLLFHHSMLPEIYPLA